MYFVFNYDAFNNMSFSGSYWAKGKQAKLYFYEKGEGFQLSYWPQFYF